MHAFYPGTFQKFDPIRHSVKLVKYHALYSGLNYKLGTLQAWRGCDIERRSIAGIIAAGHL